MTSTRSPDAASAGVGRLVLLTTSPRVAPGLLSAGAWAALRASRVLVRSEDNPQLPYLIEAGVFPDVDADSDAESLAERLLVLARSDRVVWLLGPGDDDLMRALSTTLVGLPNPPDLEHLPGSHDLPGARLLDLVALMDVLRSPGGCPWDARQTHGSLVTYLVEETYETIEAIETGDLEHLREELGDLLLQVVFHARIAQEHPDAPWSIDDVAGTIVDKLVRRHPHVFGPAAGHALGPNDPQQSADELETTWEQLKSEEKGRTSATEGIPPGLPALALANKLLSRASRTGLEVDLPVDPQSIGGRLLALVLEANAAGVDPEAELRRCARLLGQAIRDTEQGQSPNLQQ